MNELNLTKILRVKAGDTIYVTKDWKTRGIVPVKAYLVHDDCVKFGDKYLKQGRDFFLDELDAKKAVYESARRSLNALDASYRTSRKKLSDMIQKMAQVAS
jgi:hypothetical protein